MEKYITHIGTDESGKGDFFGPLVIAGVMVDEKTAKLYADLGIKDSKKLTDKRILELAAQIQKTSPHSVVAIGNARYNQLYAKFKNLNKLLAWGHARVIENILDKTACAYALSDKFGDESLILSALMDKGRKIELKQMVRAESDVAVAAASILARAGFVQKIDQMGQLYGLKFQKGCSSLVKDVAREFITKVGRQKLPEVCKTHFKTYNEV